MIKYLIAIFLLVDIVILGQFFYSHKNASASNLKGYKKKVAIETPNKMAQIASVKNELSNWPPKLNQKFPEVPLIDHQGNSFFMEKLYGKPTLIEFVAMTCAACQAWSGAHKHGTFENLAAQQDLSSIEDHYKEYTGGLDLFDGSINFVQLIIYDTALEAPTADKINSWRKHFKLDQHQNTYVVTGGKALANQESFNRIPGFMLLDKDGTIRFDALGHSPVHNLYTELLPAVKDFITQ